MTDAVNVKAFADDAGSRLKEMLRLMGFEASVQAFASEEEALLHVESPDAGRLIGKGAAVLNALQFLLNRMMTRGAGNVPHCVVDVERYRERRKDQLLEMALEAAGRAEQTGRDVRLPPMSAGDRRVIHQALKDREGIETRSGEPDEDGRKSVFVSARMAAQGEPPDNIGNE